ncbi:hypothetical protein L9Y56_005574 [Klebsiella pneumoniae]|uniref:hypothetical protein n=1 Tax=Klebsiella pneumoniae TaxID=573 RepID=UPI00073C1966|nr:hypothetical protein [Klebsiella pneumoniae]HDS9455123.1 hypothetical protein [Klebsiella quasipneumoniae subsp. similipneumoniae]EIV9538796.1 hypothetical protein [Klebsiella pneumoniae]EKT9178473.1 hypothetical protein [Klebsiella pneumoniae]EKU3951493.1 hypothetical protein [Klebsiella pneumoniae]EKU8650623.1 hypothetical protein [Klebsiella pneumoniae]
MFSHESEVIVNLVTDAGCVLGSETRSLLLYFEIKSLNISGAVCSASLFAGTDKENLQFYGAYQVEADLESGGIYDFVESYIMKLDEFSGAAKI